MFKQKRLTPNGYALIKRFEGFSAYVYNDAAGYPTIGYGHKIKPGEVFDEPMSERAAFSLLVNDISRFEKCVNESVKVPISQNMFNSLVSFAYNVGCGAFRRSTLLLKLNKGDYIGAYNEFDRWVKAGNKKLRGLVVRREAEKELFFS